MPQGHVAPGGDLPDRRRTGTGRRDHPRRPVRVLRTARPPRPSGPGPNLDLPTYTRLRGGTRGAALAGGQPGLPGLAGRCGHRQGALPPAPPRPDRPPRSSAVPVDVAADPPGRRAVPRPPAPVGEMAQMAPLFLLVFILTA